MLRKYVVVNTLFGYPCFNGRRFFTLKGAVRKARKITLIVAPEWIQIRKLL